MSILLYPIGFFVYLILIHPFFSKLPPLLFALLTYGMFIIWVFTDNTFIKYYNYFISFPAVVGSILIWGGVKSKIIK